MEIEKASTNGVNRADSSRKPPPTHQQQQQQQHHHKKLKSSHHHHHIQKSNSNDDEDDEDEEEQMSTSSSLGSRQSATVISNLAAKNGPKTNGNGKVERVKSGHRSRKRAQSHSSASSRSSSASSNSSGSLGSSSANSGSDSSSDSSSGSSSNSSDDSSNDDESSDDVSDLLSMTSDDDDDNSNLDTDESTNGPTTHRSKKVDVEEGEIIEGGVAPASNPPPVVANPALVQQYTVMKEQIKQIRKKCLNYAKKLKKLTKELKAKKNATGKKASSKHLKLKKKLESKYLTYKTRLTGLLSRQAMLISKEPSLAENKKSKRDRSKKAKSRKGPKGKQSKQDKRHSKEKSKRKAQKNKSSKSRRSQHHDSEGHAENNRERSPAHDDNSQSNAATQPSGGASAGAVKLPYPVLNDKRDMAVIKGILKEKQRGLNEMFEKTLATLNRLDNANGSDSENDQLDPEEREQKRVRLKNLHENIKLQLTRLNKQIDYVKVILIYNSLFS
jgi:nucleolin